MDEETRERIYKAMERIENQTFCPIIKDTCKQDRCLAFNLIDEECEAIECMVAIRRALGEGVLDVNVYM